MHENPQYSFKWTQEYNVWPSQQWLAAAQEAILERQITDSEYKQAIDIINKIKQL